MLLFFSIGPVSSKYKAKSLLFKYSSLVTAGEHDKYEMRYGRSEKKLDAEGSTNFKHVSAQTFQMSISCIGHTWAHKNVDWRRGGRPTVCVIN
jgi:hypothetical protein